MSDGDACEVLLKAYQATLYEVEINGQVHVMRIGQRLPAGIEAQLAANGTRDAAFLSAANPRSRVCGDAENADRHAALLHALHELGVQWLAGIGRDRTGQWPAEPSVLALGLGREQAMRLAGQFQQNAYLEVVRGAPVRLVLTALWGSPE
jgi:hypothetical protein